MKIILLDTGLRRQFFPMTLNHAIGDLRMGMFSIKERWEKIFCCKVFTVTDPYLQSVYQEVTNDIYIIVDPLVIPDDNIMDLIRSLTPGDCISDEFGTIAQYAYFDITNTITISYEGLIKKNISVNKVARIQSLSNMIETNDYWLNKDFALSKAATFNGVSKLDGNVLYYPQNILIEEGAEVYASSLNATLGPIYIGKNTQVMEGCHIRGPFSLGEGSVLKMGTKAYGATSIGRYCTVGGELKNVIIGDYSNKAHDGYLGDSIIGSWCNLGAGTSNSNVKNNASEIALWNYSTQSFENAGIKCGVIMGDYTKTAINTSLNTGSNVGVSCNVFGHGLSPKVIPNFSWGYPPSHIYDIDKAIQDIEKWMQFKQKSFSTEEQEVLRYIFENFNYQNNIK